MRFAAGLFRGMLFGGMLLLVLVGCGGSPPRPAAQSPSAGGAGQAIQAPGGGFNETDVMFLQMLVPHHQQGATIARLATGRGLPEPVTLLAAAIDTTQTAEATTMAGWLDAWGVPATAPAEAHAAHGGQPGTSAAEITALQRRTGDEFRRAFLNLLIAHQDDAVQLARMETASGGNPEVRAYAERVARSRTAQIAQMLRLLDGSG